MRARIFKQPKTSMQSGVAGTEFWVLEWEPTERREQDPLMGWFGSADTQAQVRLRFDTREEALAFAAKRGLVCDVELAPARVQKPKVYADNFRFDRIGNWTH